MAASRRSTSSGIAGAADPGGVPGGDSSDDSGGIPLAEAHEQALQAARDAD